MSWRGQLSFVFSHAPTEVSFAIPMIGLYIEHLVCDCRGMLRSVIRKIMSDSPMAGMDCFCVGGFCALHIVSALSSGLSTRGASAVVCSVNL